MLRGICSFIASLRVTLEHSNARHERTPRSILIKRVTGNCDAELASWHNIVLLDHIPDRHVVLAELERDSVTGSRVNVDASKVAKHAGWLA